MFLQSAFQFGFLPSKPCLSPLESSLEFVIHRGKPRFISLPVKFDQQQHNNNNNNNNLHANCTAVFVFFFSKSIGRNNAKVLFNTLLKIKPHDTQKRRSVRSHSVLF